MISHWKCNECCFWNIFTLMK